MDSIYEMPAFGGVLGEEYSMTVWNHKSIHESLNVSPKSTEDDPMPIDEVLGLVERLLRQISFGQIVIMVHEGRIAQVDVTEKIRKIR